MSFGARDYDAFVGRWTSKEPLRFLAERNFYVYAYNDPVNYIDPTGLEPEFAGGEGAFGGAGASGSWDGSGSGSGHEKSAGSVVGKIVCAFIKAFASETEASAAGGVAKFADPRFAA